MTRYAGVAIESAPLATIYHYRIPGPLELQVNIGVRVAVPFGPRQVRGFVVEITAAPPIAEDRIKDLRSVDKAGILVLLVLGFLFFRTQGISAPPPVEKTDHLLRDISPLRETPKGTVRAVIEIPAYTRDKWEVEETSGTLALETRPGKPRRMEYGFPYLFNYGMIPQTRMPKDKGGDGDPLDILLLGEPVARGAIVEVRVIGAIELLDGGEVDDKILAVPAGDPVFSGIHSVDRLEKRQPGVLQITQLWLENYKRIPRKIDIQGILDPIAAFQIIREAHQDYLSEQSQTQ